MSWENRIVCGVVHTLPVGDSRDHLPLKQCLCRPRVVEDDPLYHDRVIHNSFDGREYFERATRREAVHA